MALRPAYNCAPVACALVVSRSRLSSCGTRAAWKSGVLVAYLYRVDRAKPVRPMTPRKRAALAAAMTARRTCPSCRSDAGYVIPASLGMCVPCAYPDTDVDAPGAGQSGEPRA